MTSRAESTELKVLTIFKNMKIDTNWTNSPSLCFTQSEDLSTPGLSLRDFLNNLITYISKPSEKPDIWSDVLLDLMAEKDVIQTYDSLVYDILELIILKCNDISINWRIFSTKLLTKISVHLNESVINNNIIPIVQCMCHDFESDIRAEICKNLFFISLNINQNSKKSLIVPQLIELSKDTSTDVRVECIKSLIEFLPVLDNTTVSHLVLPLIINIYEKAMESNDDSLPLIFLYFGKFCQLVPINITRDKWFLKYYCDVFTLSSNFQLIPKDFKSEERDIQCRTALALNFTVLVQIYGSINELLSILDALCSDGSLLVGKSIASEFLQIVLSLKTPFLVYHQLSKLMTRKNIEILKILVPDLGPILIKIITTIPTENISDLCVNLVNSLIECENILSSHLDWRTHIVFFENLSDLMNYLPVNLIKSNLIPIITNRILTTRVIPKRLEAARCLIILFRDNPILSENINIYQWFIQKLCNSKSFYDRMIFIKICQLIIEELTDNSIIVNYIFESLLHLRNDKVPNIRLNVCKTFKLFHPLLTTVPEITSRINKLKQYFLIMLKNETDRDVLNSINELIDEFEWRKEFEKLEIEELVDRFDNLSINCLFDSNFSHLSEVNNNSTKKQDSDSVKIDSIKNNIKSSLPRMIRSNNRSLVQTSNHISDDLHTIPSRIPKPINKSIK